MNNKVLLFFKNKALMQQAASHLQRSGFSVQVVQDVNSRRFTSRVVTDTPQIALELNKRKIPTVLFVSHNIKIAVPHTTQIELLPELIKLL